MTKVTGIGGVFFKCKDPKGATEWYQKHLGLDTNPYGATDCKKCHGFEKWDRSNFNHDNTAFKLDGAHVKVDYSKCHQESWVDGKKQVT